MKKKIIIILFIFSYCFSQDVFFTAKKLAEIKSKPSVTSVTVKMLKKGDVVTVEDVITDSLNIEWYFVVTKDNDTLGYARSSELDFVGNKNSSKEYVSLSKEKKEDKRRRINMIKEHPYWSMRIKRTVRKGAICLNMTKKQLFASWNLPYQKTKGFITGIGDVDIFFYQKQDPIAVVVKDDVIIGWSEKY